MGQIFNVFYWLDLIVYITRQVSSCSTIHDVCFLREVLEHHQLPYKYLQYVKSFVPATMKGQLSGSVKIRDCT